MVDLFISGPRNKMTGAFNDINKDKILIYFLYIHLIFYKKYMIESLESRLFYY